MHGVWTTAGVCNVYLVCRQSKGMAVLSILSFVSVYQSNLFAYAEEKSLFV